MKYSPAPWNIEEHEGHARSYRYVVCAPNYDNRVAVISLNGEARGDNAIAQANARLISAAPDLLAALEQVARLGGLSSEGFDDYEDLANADDLACEILDAISKAKGEK